MLIQELATFFLPDMSKMLKAFGILVHYEDELPPAFGGSATNLPPAPVMHALPVTSAPTPPPSFAHAQGHTLCHSMASSLSALPLC